VRLIDKFIPASGPEARAVSVTQLAQIFAGDSESSLTDFITYVNEGLKGSGPVYSLIAIRVWALSEVSFKWRNYGDKKLYGNDRLRPLEHPWPTGTTGDLVAVIEVDKSLAGNAYIYRGEGRLVRWRPDWTDIILGVDGQGLKRVIGFAHWPNGRVSGNPIIATPDEVAHFIELPDPSKHFCGMSWITPVAREVDADSGMSKYKDKFFKNAATPNLKLKIEKQLEPEVRQRLLDQLAARHEGVENAYKTILVEGGADVEAMGHTFQEITFGEVQSAGETRLAAAAGVPPVVVGFLQGIQAATYSNYSQAMRRFGDLTVRPQWRKIAGVLETIVPPPAGAQLWYDDRDIPFLQQDAKDEAEIRKTNASTMESLIRAGYDPDTVVDAVMNGDYSILQHTGLVSVQLQPPGTENPAPQPD